MPMLLQHQCSHGIWNWECQSKAVISSKGPDCQVNAESYVIAGFEFAKVVGGGLALIVHCEKSYFLFVQSDIEFGPECFPPSLCKRFNTNSRPCKQSIM